MVRKSRRHFLPEEGISKILFSLLVLGIFSAVFGQSLYAQFNELASNVVLASDFGYGGGGGGSPFYGGVTTTVAISKPVQSVNPGDAVTFLVTTFGFVNPTYSLKDSFSQPNFGSSPYDFSRSMGYNDQGDDVLKLQQILGQLGFLASVSNGYFGPDTVAAVKKFQAENNINQTGQVGPTTKEALIELQNVMVAPVNTSNAAITLVGAFTWTPTQNDIGLHVITVSAQDSRGNTGSADARITVAQGPIAVTTPVLSAFSRYLGYSDHGADVLKLQQLLVALKLLTAKPNGNYGPATFAAVKKFQLAHAIKQTGNVGPLTLAALNQLNTTK